MRVQLIFRKKCLHSRTRCQLLIPLGASDGYVSLRQFRLRVTLLDCVQTPHRPTVFSNLALGYKYDLINTCHLSLYLLNLCKYLVTSSF